MHYIIKHLSIPPLIIFLAVFVLFVTNFSPNTQLSGWDNLHPEFNFGLNIERSIFAPWQEYQGLGLVGGMGHASDLPRQLLLLFSSLILPANYLRQFYFFLMLLAGPLGVYFLLQRIVIKQKLACLAGSFFYLFNLATIQTFYVGFEPFVTQYGMLPWLLLTALNYINHSSKKNLLFLIIINLLAVPQAYVPTTFLVYLVALIGSLTIISIQQKGKIIKKSLVVLLLTLLVNAFWILPFLYFVTSNISVSVEAKMNQMATETVFLQNKEFGNITDVIILKGFWFNLKDFNPNSQQFDYLLSPWREYLDNKLVLSISFILFIVVLIGIITSFKQKNQYKWVSLFLFLVPVIILANNTPPFSWIDNFLYRFSYFAQVLRSPFTKFSILASFSYSIFFAFGIALVLNLLKSRYIKLFALLIIGGLLVTFTFPIFKGNLFYKQIRINIPQDYYKMWDFFKDQNPNTRIAGFPIQTFFGWAYYRWGYSGSGFLWYGLSQPILDRAFDVWSGADENYYWEISYALYSNNKNLFEKVLQKYQVNWILVDNSTIYSLSPKSLYVNELKQLISASNKISLSQKFGQIEVYKTNFNVQADNFVYLAENLPEIAPKYKWNNLDQAYLENGDYISKKLNGAVDIYYPFRSLFTGKTQQDVEFSVEDKGSYFIFRRTLPVELKNYQLKITEMSKKDTPQLSVDNIFFDGQVIEVKVPKTKDTFSVEIDPGTVKEFWLPNLTHDRGYIIKIDSRNIQGKPLNFWIGNVDLRRADLETYLPARPAGGPARPGISFYIQPPMDEYGLGYSLHFDQGVLSDNESNNLLDKIEVYPIPFNFLTSLKLEKRDILSSPVIFPVKVEHSTPWLYKVNIFQVATSKLSTIVLSQSFDPGWQAWVYPGKFPLKQLTNHYLVNNWANGWEILPNQKGTIYIFFWPQLLEWGGFVLIIGTFIFWFKKKNN